MYDLIVCFFICCIFYNAFIVDNILYTMQKNCNIEILILKLGCTTSKKIGGSCCPHDGGPYGRMEACIH